MKMTQDQLNEIVRLHGLWLRNDAGGKRADLTDADLTGAILTDADLTGATLTHATLTRAILTRAILTRAILTRAILTDADLTDADLTDADLTDADLTDADLTGADLTGAILTDADLPVGTKTALCSWTDHGERGRTLTALLHDGALTYRCGCFCGTEAELRQYIADGKERYRASRTIAVAFCAARMAEMMGDK